MGRGWKVAIAALVIAGTSAVAQPAGAAESPEFLGEFFYNTAPKTNQSVMVDVYARDPDGGDLTTGSYQWLLDGVEIPGATGTPFLHLFEGDPEFDNVYWMQATLPLSEAGHGDKGDELSLQYTFEDGEDAALVGVTTAVTVANTLPILKANVTPKLPGTNATLSVAVQKFDADGDTLALTYRWTRNAKPITGATGEQLDLSQPGHGDTGDQIAVRVKAADGTGAQTVRSNVVGVGTPVGYTEGQIYPDFTLRNQHGEQVSLSDFEGDHVLLVLSTLWCPPSGVMSPPVPLVQEILSNHPDLPGFTYLQVELEDAHQELTDQTDAAQFATKYRVPGHVLHQNGGLSDLRWDVEYIGEPLGEPGAFPTQVFINPKGKITRVQQGALFVSDLLDHYDPDLPDYSESKTSAYDLRVEGVGMTLRIGTASGQAAQALTPATSSLHPLTGMPGRTGGVVSSLAGDTETWKVVVDTDGSSDLTRTKPIKIVLRNPSWVSEVQHAPTRSTAKLRVETVVGTRSISVPVSQASDGDVTIGPVTLADRGFAAGDPVRGLSTTLKFDHLPGFP